MLWKKFLRIYSDKYFCKSHASNTPNFFLTEVKGTEFKKKIGGELK